MNPNSRYRRAISHVPSSWWTYPPVARQIVSGAPGCALATPSTFAYGNPMSMACWFFSMAPAGGGALMQYGTFGQAACIGRLITTTTLGAVAQAASSAAGANSTINLQPRAWYHGLGTFTSNTKRDVYLDGDFTGTNATSRAGSGNTFYIGCQGSGSLYNDAWIAWPCWWSVVLSAAEAVDLVNGVPPWMIQPHKIISCPDLRTLVDPFAKCLWAKEANSVYMPKIMPAPWFLRAPKKLTGYVAGTTVPPAYNRRRRAIITMTE